MRRLGTAAVVVALTMSLAACSSEPGDDGRGPDESAGRSPSPAAAPSGSPSLLSGGVLGTPIDPGPSPTSSTAPPASGVRPGRPAVWCDNPNTACVGFDDVDSWWFDAAIPRLPGDRRNTGYVATHSFEIPEPLKVAPSSEPPTILYYFPEDNAPHRMRFRDVHASGAVVVEMHVLKPDHPTRLSSGGKKVEIHGHPASVVVASLNGGEDVTSIDWYEKHDGFVIMCSVVERTSDRDPEALVRLAQSLRFE